MGEVPLCGCRGGDFQTHLLCRQKYRGTSLIRNKSPPWDHHRALDKGLLQDPREGLFSMSEVPL